jgi:phage-related protein
MDCEQLQGFDGTAAQRASPFRLRLSLAQIAGVLEVVEDAVGGTYRAVYTVKFAEAVFVLHCFQKKSKSGIATPKADMDIIRARLKVAEALAQELRNAKTNH